MAARANLDPSRNRKAGQRGIATLEFSPVSYTHLTLPTNREV